jgi:hypothetical protein
MKAKMTAKGMLIISAETELESYALVKWNDDNRINGEVTMLIETKVIEEQP